MVPWQVENGPNTLDPLPGQSLKQWDKKGNSLHVKLRWLDSVFRIRPPQATGAQAHKCRGSLKWLLGSDWLDIMLKWLRELLISASPLNSVLALQDSKQNNSQGFQFRQ